MNVAVCAKVYEKSGKLSKTAQRYVSDGRSFKANHPLTLMIKFSRDDLLDHPLVKALISYKCKLANGIYFTFMVIFLCMVMMATMFIVLSERPHNANWSESACATADEREQFPIYHQMWMQWCIWAMLSVCVAVEFIQFLALKVRYFIQPSNYFDWFCYSSLVLITINITSCGARTLWQWQLSAFCLLASWINMAMLLRRLPLIGIYVVMLTKVAQSFANFFTILLSFIVAFAVAFFILLPGQDSFSTIGYSVLKTAVMMTGEQDFGDIFFSQSEDNSEADALRALFKSSTLVVYVIFLPTMSIIVLNLLIGLAVGDINELMKNAKIERLGLSVDLALDVEQNMPLLIQRKLINKYVRMRSGVPRCIDKVLKLTKRLIFTEASQADNRLEQLFDDVKEQVNFNARKMAKDITQQVAELNQFKKEITHETEQIKQDLANQSIETKNLMKEMLQTLKKDIMTSQNAEISNVVRELKQTLTDVKRYTLQLRTQSLAQPTTSASTVI